MAEEKKDDKKTGLSQKDAEIMEKFLPILNQIDPLIEDLTKKYVESTGQNIDRPVTFGFSIKIEPTGKAKIEELGTKPNINENPSQIQKQEWKKQEPLFDIIDSENNTIIVADVGHIDAKNVKIETAQKNKIIVSIDSKENSFFKEIELQCNVKPESKKASFKNGILEISFEKEKN